MQQATISARDVMPPSPAILAPAAYAHFSRSGGPSFGWVRLLGLHLKTWVQDRAASAAEAVLYQELSKLSDTELERRGIPRGELHRCIARGR
jgi:hypothetical protein